MQMVQKTWQKHVQKIMRSLFTFLQTMFFDGENNLAYTEEDFTNPLGVYGASKLAGDELALEVNPCSVILRTSWVYSEFGKILLKPC